MRHHTSSTSTQILIPKNLIASTIQSRARNRMQPNPKEGFTQKYNHDLQDLAQSDHQTERKHEN